MFVYRHHLLKSVDGTSYASWVDRAQEIFRTADSSEIKLPALPRPKSGLPASVQSAFSQAESPAGTSVNIVWGALGQSLVFKVDRTNDRLVLNNRYKKEIIRVGV